jgi:hypothetical protein
MPSRTAYALLPTLIALALVPVHAAADWSSPPQAVSAPGADTIVSLGFDQRGRGLMGWAAQPGHVGYTATLPPGGMWAPPKLLPRSIGYAGFALQPYARSRALMLAKVRTGEGRRVRYRIGAAPGTSVADFGRFATLDSGRLSAGTYASRSLSIPVLAVNVRGNAIAAWMRYVRGVASVRVAERIAGHPFSRRRTLGRVQPFRTAVYQSGYRVPAAVAIDARGNRVVAWYHERRINARIHRAGGRWGKVQRIGRAVHPPPTISAAASRGGFLVAWGTLAQSRDRRVFEHTAALRPAGGRWRTWRLERFATAPRAPFASAEREVVAAFDSSGRGVAAWTGALAGHAAVKLAIASGPGFGPIQVLSGARNARLGGLATGPAEKLAVSWWEETGEQFEQTVPYARVGSRLGGFSPAELVGRCSRPGFCNAGDVKIAFDPVSAQPTAAWVERTDAGYLVLSARRR